MHILTIYKSPNHVRFDISISIRIKLAGYLCEVTEKCSKYKKIALTWSQTSPEKKSQGHYLQRRHFPHAFPSAFFPTSFSPLFRSTSAGGGVSRGSVTGPTAPVGPGDDHALLMVTRSPRGTIQSTKRQAVREHERPARRPRPSGTLPLSTAPAPTGGHLALVPYGR